MGRLLTDFFPNDTLFFNLFDQVAGNAAGMAELLACAECNPG